MFFSEATFDVTGRLGADPEGIAQGKGARVSIAVEERYKKTDGEWESNTFWLSVVGWGKTGEAMIKHLSKGSSARFKGNLRTRKDGEKYYTDLVVTGFNPGSAAKSTERGHSTSDDNYFPSEPPPGM